MNLLFRILLAIYAFFLTIISVVAMLITFRPVIFNSISYYLTEEVLDNRNASFIMFLIALGFFSLSFIFLFSGLKSNKDKKAVSKYTNVGEIKISLHTIENIALAASRKLSGVRDSKAYIIKQNGNVAIIIKVVVLPDINIPNLSEDIQVKVKKSVEESSGINVDYVKVTVDNIYTGYRSRVE